MISNPLTGATKIARFKRLSNHNNRLMRKKSDNMQDKSNFWDFTRKSSYTIGRLAKINNYF